MGRRRLSPPGIGSPTRTMHAAWLLLPAFFLLISGLFAAPASASTVSLRPDGATLVGSWFRKVDPTPPSLEPSIFENIVQPAHMGVADDYIGAVVNGPAPAEVTVGSYPLRGGENITTLKA